jgi:hypothetical protein
MKKFPVIITIALVLALFGTEAYAYDEDSSINAIRFYGPSVCSINDSTNRQTYIEQDSVLAEWVSKNYASVTSLSAEYGLPWEPIMAQGAIESKYGSSDAFAQHNNIFVLGPDGNGLNKDASYPDLESAWRTIFEYWRLNAGANRKKIFNEDSFSNPEHYIDAMSVAGYQAGNEQYFGRLRVLTTQINVIAERNNLDSSKDIFKNTSAIEKNIERNQGGGVNNFGNAADYTSTECNCGGDSGASGVRWSGFWLANNSLFGSQKAPVMGMPAEKKLAAKDYGLNFEGSERKLNFRIKNGDGSIADGNPYAAYPNGDYPHFVVDIKKKRVFQYFPINLSAAAASDKNLENGIVIDVVGYTEDNGSNYYLWNTEKNSSSEWKYLAKLVKAIGEESDVKLVAPTEGTAAQLWGKVSEYVDFSKHKAAIKCGTLDNADSGLTELEAKRFVNFYDRSVSINEYDLPLKSKEMPASFVAYFIERFTTLENKNLNLGEPRDVAKNLTVAYPSLETGNDPEPYAIFSSTNSNVLCDSARCGSTGVVLAVKNGTVTTIEQVYPQAKLVVKKRSLAELKNAKYGTSFVYLRPVMNEEQLKNGRAGE